MTVSSIVPVNNYTGNSSVKKFDFDFLIEDASELIVQYTNKLEETKILTLGVDYSINEIGNPNGSYIVFPLDSSSYNILSNDEKISLMLTLSIKQESEFKNSSYFNLNILEWTFDYIIRILQILNRKIERSVKISEGASSTPDEIINQIKTSEINALQAANTASKAKTFIEENEALYIVAEDIKGPNNIASVLGNKINIDKVANSISNVNAVGNNIDNVNIVAVNKDNINIVVKNEANINTCVQNINDIKTAYKSSIDSAASAKQWAVSDVMIENGLYSAKYYAEHAQGLSDVTYNDLRSVNAFENNGNFLINEEAYYDVLNNAHSTFDKSKFMVIGNPIITNDGIASGFSTSNYIYKELNITAKNNIKLKYSFNYNINNVIQGVIAIPSIGIRQVIGTTGNLIFYNSEEAAATFSVSEIKPSANEEIKIEIILADNNFKISVITNTSTVQKTLIQPSGALLLERIYIGCNAPNYLPLVSGSIDLKTLAVKIDETPVFSGNKTGIDTFIINDENIEIPYTLSKAGSKIVDAAYRDRVQDVYEQFGTAMYYTIDEENKNFTLPMGEIYGMIEQKAEKTTVDNEISSINQNKLNKNGSNAEFPYIVETYNNDGSWYRLWSDGWCEQGGILKVETETVTFLKKMADTNYSRWVCGSADGNTTSGHNYMHSLTTTSAKVRGFGFSAWGIAGYAKTNLDDEYVEEQEPTL